MAKVLVVEDDKFLGLAYQATLTHAGMEFRLATDGEDALEVLAEWVPDVIVLDLRMPRKDGFETLAGIRKNEALSHVPVLVASNLGQKEDLDRAMALGAQGFIIKSNSSPDQLVASINGAMAAGVPPTA